MVSSDLDQAIATVRRECTQKWAGKVLKGEVPPIRGMARLAREAQDLVFRECIRRGMSDADARACVASAIVDRTIGDVDVRAIREPGYADLADEMGVRIPGEPGAAGANYVHLRERMQGIELDLLQNHGIDLRMYDVLGVGNVVLREQLRDKMAVDYGLEFPVEQIYVCLGGINGMDRTIRALRQWFRQRGQGCVFGFPAPGFAIAKWQAESNDLRVNMIQTAEEASYKLTPRQMHQIFAAEPDLRALYLTITNNPTAYSYSPDELNDLFAVISAERPEIFILADLAYIGTADPETDKARMLAFKNANMMDRTVFISSLSKTFTLTGDRFGWVSFSNPALTGLMSLAWNNISAGLPREWQLSFMAHLELMRTRPDLSNRLRALYAMRRQRLIAQLHQLNAQFDIFAEIGHDEGGGVYNWCKFNPGQDTFTLFEKTGIAGVPGSAFGYNDRFVRFSVGIVPSV